MEALRDYVERAFHLGITPAIVISEMKVTNFLNLLTFSIKQHSATMVYDLRVTMGRDSCKYFDARLTVTIKRINRGRNYKKTKWNVGRETIAKRRNFTLQ